MNDYDSRQLNLMVEKLDAFQRQSISFSNLIVSLDALLNALEGADEQWKKAFQKQWGKLEDTRAVMSAEKLSSIPDDHSLVVSAAVKELRELISQARG